MTDNKVELNDEDLDKVTGGFIGFSSDEEKQNRIIAFEEKFKNIIPDGMYSQLYGCLFGNRIINITLYNAIIDRSHGYINNPQAVIDLKNFPNDFETCEVDF